MVEIGPELAKTLTDIAICAMAAVVFWALLRN